jgi:hypothetical protein
LVGDYIETGKYTKSDKIISGVHPIDSTLYNATSSPKTVGSNLRVNNKDSLFNNIQTTVVTADSQMAKSLANAKAQLSRLTTPAKGNAQGDPRIFPYRTVEVRGTGSVTDGFWVVESCTHHLYHDGRYQVDFTCLADGTGMNKTSGTRPQQAGSIGVRNVEYELAQNIKQIVKKPKLHVMTPLIQQSNGGFKVAPRRWKG